MAKDIGKVSVLASRARTNRSGLLTATQLFAYSNFTLFKGRENSLMKMNEGEVIESFSEIRNSLDNMAYASYFCDIANHICTDGTEENELLGLLLRVLKETVCKGRKYGGVAQNRVRFSFPCAFNSGVCAKLRRLRFLRQK